MPGRWQVIYLFSQDDAEAAIDMVSFAYFHKVNIYLLQSFYTPLLEKFLVTWASFLLHQTNFWPAGKFDRTLGPHETVQYFRSVH